MAAILTAPQSQAPEARGTVERGQNFPVNVPSDFGTWNEDGCQNPILYFTEQKGMKQKVMFDLAIAHFDSIGEGPITITVKLDIPAHHDEPLDWEIESVTVFVSGMGSHEVSKDSSLYERFAGAAQKIARIHFSRFAWDRAFETELEDREESDRHEYAAVEA